MRLPRFPDAAPVANDTGAVQYGVSRVMRELSRVCAISTDSESVAILSALSERFDPSSPAACVAANGRLNPSLADETPDDDAPFPGVFAGANAGDFAGLPPAPKTVAARVPELAARLGEIGELFGSYLRHNQRGMSSVDYGQLFVGSTKLRAIIDELAAEAGDQ